METDIFSIDLVNAFKNLDINLLYEIRLRTGYPISVNYKNKKVYLSEKGISLFESSAIICKKEHIDFIINSVTENSVYAFNESIKKGYLTSKTGIRIGLAGECVFDSEIVTINCRHRLKVKPLS